MLSLYVLKQLDEPDWDEYEGFVVQARGEPAARAVVQESLREDFEARRCPEKEYKRWADPEQSSCDYLGTGDPLGEPKVILAAYKSG